MSCSRPVADVYVSSQPKLHLGEPAANKPYANFESFYNGLYKREHSVDDNRYLHIAGTSLVIGFLLWFPGAAVAMVAAGALGVGIFPYTRHLPHGIGEALAVVPMFVFLSHKLTGRWWVPLAILLLGYGFAWFGHFFIQKNTPATFIYPTFSLMSDFRMFYDTVSNKWSV
jgi:hypothetical protein